jgi:hypothetical protein
VAIAISSTDFAGQTVNMTTEGTEDWLSSPTVNPTTTFRMIGTAPHKRLGGRLLMYFDWANPGGTGFTQAMGFTRTSTAADSTDGAAVNTTTGAGFFHASVLEMGWRLRAHASEVQRRLCVYTSHWSSVLTIQAKLDGVTTSTTLSSGASTVARRRWVIDYDSFNLGAELTVAFNITTGLGATPNIAFGAATLQRL